MTAEAIVAEWAIIDQQIPTCPFCQAVPALDPGMDEEEWRQLPTCGRAKCADLLRRHQKAVDEAAHLASELDWLWGTDTPENIARRLKSRTVSALYRKFYRYGQFEAARLLRDYR